MVEEKQNKGESLPTDTSGALSLAFERQRNKLVKYNRVMWWAVGVNHLRLPTVTTVPLFCILDVLRDGSCMINPLHKESLKTQQSSRCGNR